MEEFDDKNIKDGEKPDAHNQGFSDDDTFHLESLDGYPGELPDYSDLESKEDVISESKDSRKKYFYWSAALLLLAFLMFVSYEWGVNRDGFSDLINSMNKTISGITGENAIIDSTENNSEEGKSFADSDFIVYDESYNEQNEVEKVDTIFLDESPYNSPEKTYSEPKKQPNPPRKPKPLPKPPSGFDLHQEYTVQVYATPSKEDAEDWVKKLQNKNIKNVYISTHKKRENQWYRVRFGSFATLEDAKLAALKNGLTHSWIDRVK
jgi:hypothetical protein